MRWQRKAAIMRFCARLPFGDRLYKQGQKSFGRLRADPMSRLTMQIEMARWLQVHGLGVESKRFLEVGTGHIPVVPIGLFLTGAARVDTFDLHRRIDWGLTRDALSWIASNRQIVEPLYQGVVAASVFEARFAVLARMWRTPQRFCEEARICYRAPSDAAHTGLPSGSIDCQFSMTVLEHIPPAIISDILVEARRLLALGGLAIHFIDLSDHFQHQDASIKQINFLRFGEEEWQRMAGNEFAYCNRLRGSDYSMLFARSGYETLRMEAVLDEESLQALREGFVIDPIFKPYEAQDICVSSVKLLLQ